MCIKIPSAYPTESWQFHYQCETEFQDHCQTLLGIIQLNHVFTRNTTFLTIQSQNIGAYHPDLDTAKDEDMQIGYTINMQDQQKKDHTP